VQKTLLRFGHVGRVIRFCGTVGKVRFGAKLAELLPLKGVGLLLDALLGLRLLLHRLRLGLLVRPLRLRRVVLVPADRAYTPGLVSFVDHDLTTTQLVSLSVRLPVDFIFKLDLVNVSFTLFLLPLIIDRLGTLLLTLDTRSHPI